MLPPERRLGGLQGAGRKFEQVRAHGVAILINHEQAAVFPPRYDHHCTRMPYAVFAESIAVWQFQFIFDHAHAVPAGDHGCVENLKGFHRGNLDRQC